MIHTTYDEKNVDNIYFANRFIFAYYIGIEMRFKPMKQTKYWKVNLNELNNNQAIDEAAVYLKEGLTVAFPTETVYGLGADATNKSAVSKIFTAKSRPEDNPLIAHVATKQQLKKLVIDIPVYAEQLIDTFSPGPITFVLPSNGVCADNVTARLRTIAVRLPSHPVAQQLLKKCNLPIAAPSANLSGKPSPTTAHHVLEDLNGKIDGILDGGQTGIGVESTVLDCTGDTPVILRPGGITKEQIKDVVGKVKVASTSSDEENPSSPGIKYKHYTPEVPLWLVEGSVEDIQSIINKEQKNKLTIAVLARSHIAEQLEADRIIPLGETLNDVANHLYDALRFFQAGEVDLIISEAFPEEDIGDAIMNRLRKAASVYINKDKYFSE